MKATIAIEFAEIAEDQDLILELDDVKNAGASSFVPGSDVWIRAYTQSPITVREATQGKLRVQGADLRIDNEEEIRFEDSQEAQIDRPFIEVLSAEWIGSGLGALTVSGRTVRASKQGYGVAKIAYTSAFTRLKLSDVGKAGTAIAWAEDAAGRKGSLAVSFGGAEDDRDVVIVVRDYCTDLPIANAEVRVDGLPAGETDAYGRVIVGKQPIGSSHSLLVSAPGYKESDQDALKNDNYTVG